MDRVTAPPALPDEDRDHIVVLHNVSWAQYDVIDQARGPDVPRPLIAYLDGDLELVTTSTQHERIKTMLARLVEAYAFIRGLRLDGFGHATQRRKAKRAGVEPDVWFKTRQGSKRPDLAIEVVVTSGGVNKLEIYRRLGVSEVWFWIKGRIWVYELVGRSYEQRSASREMPGIDLAELERIIAAVDDETDQMAVIRAYHASLQR